MTGQPLKDRSAVMELAMEVANDLIAFDSHIALLFADREQGEPETIWHYDEGPLYAGKEFDREAHRIRRIWRTYALKKGAIHGGLRVKGGRACLAMMIHGKSRKGVLAIQRSGDVAFTKVDMKLLSSVACLAVAAMYDHDARTLLQRLHIHFLDRRTAIYQSDTISNVVEEYLKKTECVIHPELFDVEEIAHSDSRIVRTSVKLVTSNQTALYIAGARSITVDGGVGCEWSRKRLSARYYADDKSSITARVFSTQTGYCANDHTLRETHRLVLFRDIKAHMSAPIVAGGEPCHGVLAIEATGDTKYGELQLHALTLLAAQAARPLGHARDHEIAAGRERDMDVMRDMMHGLQECRSWGEIQGILSRGLKRLRYRRGLMCRVDYDRQLVIGSRSWGPQMANLCCRTRRHFIRNQRDCQVIAVRENAPQLISNPKRDARAHRDAVKVAGLSPFAIIPLMDRTGKVTWTLHVEREDTAPIGPHEMANLQVICRAAIAAKDRIEARLAERATTTKALHCAQLLQERFLSGEELLCGLAKFLASRLDVRCRVYRVDGDRLVGLYRAGPHLGRLKRFVGFELEPSSTELFATVSKDLSPVVVRVGSRAPAVPKVGDFHVVNVDHVAGERALGKTGLGEWVEFCVFADGMPLANIALDRKRPGRSEGGSFAVEDLYLLNTASRLASLAMARTILNQILLQQAVVGTSMSVFMHEIQAIITSLSNLTQETNVTHDRLVSTVRREAENMRHLREFFRGAIADLETVSAKRISLAKEINEAIELLRIQTAPYIRLPQVGHNVRIKAKGHVLCLIVLQLLTNARKAIEKGGQIWIDFQSGRLHKPHILRICNTGTAVDPEIAEILRQGSIRVMGPGAKGLGLRYAQLLALAHGWELHLVSASEPTKFEIRIPN